MSDFKPFNAYIVHCVRTPGGKRNGSLSGWHPTDLGAYAVDALIDQAKIDPNLVDDVVIGCVTQIGSQGTNIGRNVVLASKLPESCPGVAIDRQCGSGQQAMQFAAQGVMSGTQDVVIAGGVEVMSLVPIWSNIHAGKKEGHGIPVGENIREKYGKRMVDEYAEFEVSPEIFSQFGGAEMLGKKWNISRDEADSFAMLSQERAAAATKAGNFRKEIVPIPAKVNANFKGGNAPMGMVIDDEGIRATTKEGLAKLKNMHPHGIVTAANASQVTDGSSAVLIANERGLQKLGLKPRAKIISMCCAGSDPVIMLDGPIAATQKCLKQINMPLEKIDKYEVNEAFATVPLSWYKALNADFNKLNVNGGAMALGHPLGSTGTKLATTLIHDLERNNQKYGLLAICEAGGSANAMVFEIVKDVGPTSKL